MIDFAAAVDAFREALAVFDAPSAPSAPRPQRLVDAGPLLEQMALERETAMAASTSKARQAARPVASLAPRPYRRNVTSTRRTAAIERSTKQQAAEEAAAARFIADIRKREQLEKQAADAPREVETMGRGQAIGDEKVLQQVQAAGGPVGAGQIAEGLGCSTDAVRLALSRLEKDGKATWARGPGRGAPRVWREAKAAVGDPASSRLIDASPANRSKFAKRLQANGALGAELAFDGLSRLTGEKQPDVKLLGFASSLERLIGSESKRRAACILYAEADRLKGEAEEEAAGGAP